MNLRNDQKRWTHVEKATVNQDHDYSKFGTGEVYMLKLQWSTLNWKLQSEVKILMVNNITGCCQKNCVCSLTKTTSDFLVKMKNLETKTIGKETNATSSLAVI